MMTSGDAHALLRSADCPTCERSKRRGDPLCIDCKRFVPDHMRKALCRTMADGLPLAIQQAIEVVKAQKTSATFTALGTERNRIERRRRHEAKMRELAAKKELASSCVKL